MLLKLICAACFHLLWTLQCINNIPLSEGANILFFFPAGTFSHKQSIWPMVTALADQGHNVSFLSGYNKRPYEHPKVHDLYSTAMASAMSGLYEVDRLDERRRGVEMKLFDNYNRDEINVCEKIFNSPEDPVLQYILHEGQFDLIVNNYVLGDCGLILAHVKKAKLIVSASCVFYTFFYDTFGFPPEASWIPDISVRFDFPMGILDRIYNYVVPIKRYLTRRYQVFPALEGIMQKAYGLKDEEVPSLLNVEQGASLVFVLTHLSTDFPRALPPMVVSVGGMQCWTPSKPLTGEFKEILDGATNGAILIAFGSSINLATMPQYFKNMFLEMMTHFPEITFIWRWDGPLPPNPPKNLIVSKWLPQFQILAHPNLKGFISHAGLNSLTEATFHGVPVILLPLFADQDYNGYRIEATKIGIRLEVRELSTQIMVHSVNEILTNPIYNKNMKAMSAVMKDRPMNPIETAVYWTEFVLRHEDTSSLKPLQHQSWFERRQLDVLLFLLALSSCIGAGVLLGCFYLCTRLFSGEGRTLTKGRKPLRQPVKVKSNGISARRKKKVN